MLNDNDFTHVICGYSAAATIKDAFNLTSDQIIKCGDLIAVGQQNLRNDFDLWEKARLPAQEKTLDTDLANFMEREQSFRLFHDFSSLAAGRPVLIWLDCTVASQLVAAFLCNHFKSNAWDLGRLHTLSYAKAEELYMGILGVLSERKLLERRPEIKKMSAHEVDQYAKIWAAFAGPDLDALLCIIQDNQIAELTMDAMSYLLRRLPSRFNGLNEIDQKLLKYGISEAPSAIRAVALALGHDETPDMVGDLHLFARIKRFGSPNSKHPLIRLDNPAGDMRKCQLEILPLAHDILEGRANMIELNGLDDWLGGIHLTPHNFAYREDIALP